MAKVMSMLFNKKGIFLTFIAISIITALIIIFTPSNTGFNKDIPAVKARVSNLNNYVLDLQSVYLERVLQSSGTKAVNSLIKYMESQNKFLSNFEASFREVLLYGTISGQPIDNFIDPDIMTNNTYKDWINKTIAIADNSFNIRTNITVNDVKVYQTRPWFLTVDASVSLQVTSETAAWAKTISVITDISIDRFYDPYYSINTAGFYKNKINKTSVLFAEWDLNKVKGHLKSGTYMHYDSSNAPNFIMRFTNTSGNSSCCGIESLVNPNKLAGIGSMESYADDLFFNHSFQNKCSQLFNATSVWPDYKPLQLDFTHLALYNLTSYSFVVAC